MKTTMLHSPEHLSIGEISSPISVQNFEFSGSDLFQETLQNSEVASSSNCCYEENSYITKLSLPQHIDKLNSYQNKDISTNISSTTTTSSSTTPDTNTIATSNHNNNLCVIFDSTEELDNDISASINFSPFPSFPFLSSQQDQIDYASLQCHIPITDSVVEGLSQYHSDPVVPLIGPPSTSVFDEDSLSSVPCYLPLNATSSSCSFLYSPMGTFMPETSNDADSSAIYDRGILLGSELQQEVDFQGENGGIYSPDSMQMAFNQGDLQQTTCSESQQLENGGAISTPLASKMLNLEESTFKVGKLSAEERKEKIHKYLKKRNQRNFSKKIKYACRKTLADSRLRVRGRFAKNDDFGETYRPTCSNHEDDDDEEILVKEEDEIIDSLDIFAHISGVNSFNCNYTINSWI